MIKTHLLQAPVSRSGGEQVYNLLLESTDEEQPT